MEQYRPLATASKGPTAKTKQESRRKAAFFGVSARPALTSIVPDTILSPWCAQMSRNDASAAAFRIGLGHPFSATPASTRIQSR